MHAVQVSNALLRMYGWHTGRWSLRYMHGQVQVVVAIACKECLYVRLI